MIKYEKRKWDVYDPDEILIKTRSGFDESQFGLRKGGIWPRDDLMYFKHNEKPYTVDFGYHGDVFELDGYWLVYVINNELEEPWEEPIERHEVTSFLLAVEKVQSIVQKYT